MNIAQNIADRFGGQTALARVLGFPQTTVSYWCQRGLIPAKHQAPILAEAKARGISLQPADFFPAEGAA